MEYRTTQQEFNYYGSDLNKFVDEFCRRDMTAMNIDLNTHKRINRADGSTLNLIRIIESKHSKERIGNAQLETLKTWANISKEVNKNPDYQMNVYIIRGDYPYNTAVIENLTTGNIMTLNKKDLISFLDFKLKI